MNETPTKKITVKEKILMLLQPKIRQLIQVHHPNFTFNEHSVIKVEKRIPRKTVRYVAIINNHSVYISRRIYNLFPQSNKIKILN